MAPTIRSAPFRAGATTIETPLAPNSPLSAPMKIRTPSEDSASSSSRSIVSCCSSRSNKVWIAPRLSICVTSDSSRACPRTISDPPRPSPVQVANPASTTCVVKASNCVRSAVMSAPTVRRSSARLRSARLRPSSRAFR